MAVTGEVKFYSEIPKVTQTRLTSIVDTGALEITVAHDVSESWKVGDEIVFGASQMDGLGFEKHTVAGFSEDGKTVTLGEAVVNWHYGHAR